MSFLLKNGYVVTMNPEREVYFAASNAYVSCKVFDRYILSSDCRIEGPAIVEEMDSTTLVQPRSSAHVDPYGNLVIQS